MDKLILRTYHIIQYSRDHQLIFLEGILKIFGGHQNSKQIFLTYYYNAKVTSK